MAFKKFGKDEISGFTQVKASVARGIRCECSALLVLGRFLQQLCCFHPSPSSPPSPPCVCNCCAASVGEQYPYLADSGVLDVLFPKKEPVFVAKTYVGRAHAGIC
jgi:hypothetical protein